MDTAALLGKAMTDYVLAAGTNKAPALQAPGHMAAWLTSRGYRLVRTSRVEPVGSGDGHLADRIAALVTWPAVCTDGQDRRAIVQQVLAAVAAGCTDAHRVV